MTVSPQHDCTNDPAVSPEEFALGKSFTGPVDSSTREDLFVVEGEVFEVLDGFGLAQVRSLDGSIYGLNRQTLGVGFGTLRVGQRVRLDITSKFSRVLHAQLIG